MFCNHCMALLVVMPLVTSVPSGGAVLDVRADSEISSINEQTSIEDKQTCADAHSSYEKAKSQMLFLQWTEDEVATPAKLCHLYKQQGLNTGDNYKLCLELARCECAAAYDASSCGMAFCQYTQQLLFGFEGLTVCNATCGDKVSSCFCEHSVKDDQGAYSACPTDYDWMVSAEGGRYCERGAAKTLPNSPCSNLGRKFLCDFFGSYVEGEPGSHPYSQTRSVCDAECAKLLTQEWPCDEGALR